jgi:hypothetical protein
MSYYRIPSYELDSRRRYYKQNPDVLGIFSRENDERRREGVGKGWTYTQEREHAQNFKPLGADWTYENDGDFLLDFLRDPPSRARSGSRSRGYRHPGDRSKSLRTCSTCKKLESHYGNLHTNPHKLAAAAESCMVCELLAKACKDAGATEEEEVQVTLPMNSEGAVFLMLHVGLGTYLFLSFPDSLAQTDHNFRTGRVSPGHPNWHPPVACAWRDQPLRPLPCLAP